LIHGLKLSNVLFNEYHRIQILDFGRSRLDLRESTATARGVVSEFAAPEMRSGEERTAKIDVFSFVLILFEIVVGLSFFGGINTSEEIGKLSVNVCERVDIPGFIPELASVLIESGLSDSQKSPSFNAISDVLKEKYFRIADGVDSDEVSSFVRLVESSET
jgi:serine/threonine protein kinase